MSHLKSDTLKRCVSLLREFVEASEAQEGKKGAALLTLNQLQKVMAGMDSGTDVLSPSCTGRPIAGLS